MILIHGGQKCQNLYIGTFLSVQNKKIISSSGDSQVGVTYGLKTTPIRKIAC